MKYQNLKRKIIDGLKTAGKVSGVLIPLALAGCKTEIPERAPTLEDFVGTNVTISDYPLNYPRLLHDLEIVDEDKDGQADVILKDPFYARYVRKGHVSKLYDIKEAEIMTPEIQELADIHLRTGQELAYTLTRDRYIKLKGE